MKSKFCEDLKELTEEDVIAFRNGKFSLDNFAYQSELTEQFVDEFHGRFDVRFWDFIGVHYNLTEDFIRKYQSNLSWKVISYWQDLSESFIEEFSDKVNWDKIFTIQKLSKDFYRKFCDKINWVNCNIYINTNDFPEDVFEKYIDEVNFQYAAIWVDLSMDFLNKYCHLFDEPAWRTVATYQKIDNDFIFRNIDKLPFDGLLKNKDINEGIKNYIRMFI